MRRLHDPVYRAVGPSRGRVRPVEQRALALIERRPGMTVTELRDTLGVGSSRVWQIVSCSPASNTIVTYDSGQGYAWDVRPASWAARACAVAGRPLTRTEWD